MAASLYSQSERFSQFLICKSPCFLPSFESIGLLDQEKKHKIDFQDSGHRCHLGFPIRRILAIFLSTSHPDAFYEVSSQLAFRFSRRDFQDGLNGGHLGYPIGNILAIFDLQVNPDVSYQVSSQLAFRFRRRSEK